jgi:hypothetical protein
MRIIKNWKHFNEAYGKFNMDDFKNLKSFKERIKYCNFYLERIGGGSSRRVYKLTENTVLKLAKNTSGLEQNYNEVSNFVSFYDSIISKVYDSDKVNNEWIVSELVKKTNIKQFEKLTGFNFDKYGKYLSINAIKNNPQKYKGYSYKDLLTPEEINMFDKDEHENNNIKNFITLMVTFMLDFDLDVGDLIKINSYGVVNRGDFDRIVLIDYGFST